jgi:poly(A) polymerase
VAAAEGWQQISPAQGEGAWRELIYRIGPDRFVDRVLVAWARSPAGAADAEWKAFATLPTRWTAPTFPLKSKEFTRRGVEKGPRLGATIAAAEEAWIAAGFPADKAALTAIADAAVVATAGAPP